MTLTQVLAETPPKRGDQLLALFRSTASKDAIRLAWVLAAAIAVPREEVEELVRAAQFEHVDVDAAVSELHSWPFLLQGSDGLRIDEPFSHWLVADFHRHEAKAGAFVRAYEWLVERERRRELAADDGEVWFVRGRIAYYLAGIASEQSVDAFIDRFSDAPVVDRTAARIWLSGLALEQRSLLSDHVRELAFFRGFQLYVANRRDDALHAFEEVIGPANVDAGIEGLPHRDRFAAIALHLAATIIRQQRPAVATNYLTVAVELSEILGVFENEVMARQSLVWNLVERGQRSDSERRAARYEQAFGIARTNLDKAKFYGDPYLLHWTEHTAAETEWVMLTDNHRVVPAHAVGRGGDLAKQLEDLASARASSRDVESALLTLNASASIYRDLREYERALTVIENGLAKLDWVGAALSGYVRLAKTVGSIAGRGGLPQAIRSRARRLLDRLDQMPGVADRRRRRPQSRGQRDRTR